VAGILVILLSTSACDAVFDRSVGRSPVASAEAASSPTPSPSVSSGSVPAAPAPICHSVPISIRFDYRGAVPKAERVEIRKDSELARAYYGVKTDSCIPDKVFTFVYPRLNKRVVALTRGESAIQIFTKTPGWVDAPSASRAVVVLHEWYHIVQARTLTVHWNEVPTWLIEGTAVWTADKAASDLGFYTSFAIPQSRELRSARDASIPLASWKPFAPGAYPLAFAAVDFLVTPNNGRRRLRTFFESVGRGTRWQEAFQSVFGVAVNKFFAAFSTYRDRGFRK
jgi:hypothetical protein